MKKRLLALALCLVLATSLLPITAAAAFPSDSVMYSWAGGIKNGGIYCGDIYITDASPEGFRIDNVRYTKDSYFYTVIPDSGQWKLDAGLGTIVVQIDFFDILSGDAARLHYDITINSDHTWSAWTSNGNGTHSRSCTYKDTCGGYETEACVDTNRDHKCDVCYGSVHTWSYEVSKAGDSLTATCGGQGCDFPEVGVTLKAHSVTLPEGPFNATVETTGNFKEVFSYGDIFYRYKDPTNGWIDVDDPKTFTPKPGEYQAGIWVYGLPGNGEVAARATSNDDGTNQGGKELLFVKYTAVDPAVTAQTGDNRPIEIMMAGVLVFSALAAAAFILDNKRKYSR